MTRTKSAAERVVNPDVLVLPDDTLRLTLVIDKINSEYDGVKVEAKEATYDQRRDEFHRSSERPMLSRDFQRHCSRASFTIPIELAAGYAIGSVIQIIVARSK